MQNRINNTFWNLINNHRIEIPIIQRDFVQGRSDIKTENIRLKFVGRLVDALEKNEPLSLDFIYGKVEGKTDVDQLKKNKESIKVLYDAVQAYSQNLKIPSTFNIRVEEVDISTNKNTFFIPLDGQQRLTTLFLLHWYISSKLNVYSSEDENPLIKFSYKIRPSSKDFCEQLVSNKMVFNKAISTQIKDSPWFFKSWVKDPTVKGMLVMLDAIEDKLKKFTKDDLNDFWDRLTREDLLTFNFLDIEKYKLTDDLYVKMNARGKSLSDFENFKSSLLEVAENYILLDDWQQKIDISWTDIFWKNKELNDYEIDSEFMSYFKLMALFSYSRDIRFKDELLDPELIDEELFKDELLLSDIKTIDSLIGKEFIPFSFFEKIQSFNNEKLNDIFSVLTSLEGEGYTEAYNFLDPIFYGIGVIKRLIGKDIFNLTWWHRSHLYSFTQFFIFKNKNLKEYSEEDQEQFVRWMRVTTNLIFNNPIESHEQFVKSVREIDKLAVKIDDIYNLKDLEIKFFSKDQIQEEKLKCSLILQDEKWEKSLIKYEKHEYFYAQIGFLLELSKYNGEYDFNLFNNYAEKIAPLFESSILSHNEFILQRALLTKGNYLIDAGNKNAGFCEPYKGTYRLREENWRRVFKSESRLNLLKELVNDKLYDLNDPLTSLNDIIDTSGSDDWMGLFVKNPLAIEYSDTKRIRINNSLDIQILKTTRIYGTHSELRSYVFFKRYLENKKDVILPFIKPGYYSSTSESDFANANLSGWKYEGQEYSVAVYYTDAKFHMRFLKSGEIELTQEHEVPNNIIDILKTFGFNGLFWVKDGLTIENMYDHLIDLCNQLKKNHNNSQT